MKQEKHKQLIEKINSGNFADFDSVTFDKDGLFVILSGKDFQKLMSKDNLRKNKYFCKQNRNSIADD